MPRIRDNRCFEPEWVRTDAERTRWRRHFVIGLLGHIGFSSRWIADALEMSDPGTRKVLASETVREIDFSKLLA